MIESSITLHDARAVELAATRGENVEICAGFIGEHGGRLQGGEESLSAILQQVSATGHGIAAEKVASDKLEVFVQEQVAAGTDEIRAKKDGHISNRDRIDSDIEELRRQVETKLAERQVETDAIDEVDAGVEAERQKFSKELADVDNSRQTIDRQEQVCLDRTAAVEAQWGRLEDYRAEIAAQRETVVEFADENSAEEEKVRKSQTLLRLWLSLAEQDKVAEEKAASQAQFLGTQLAKAQAELQTLASSNSEFSEGMSRLQTEKSQFQSVQKRCEHNLPALEAEKKTAASSRNFKEASRLSGEIKKVEAEKDEAERKLTSLGATIAAKQSENAALAQQLAGLTKAVDDAQKAANVSRLDHLKTQITALKARVATATGVDEGNKMFYQAQLDVATEEAEDLCVKYSMPADFAEAAAPLSIPAVAPIEVVIAELPLPVPRMSEEEAMAVMQAFAGANKDLEDRLEAAMVAEGKRRQTLARADFVLCCVPILCSIIESCGSFRLRRLRCDQRRDREACRVASCGQRCARRPRIYGRDGQGRGGWDHHGLRGDSH